MSNNIQNKTAPSLNKFDIMRKISRKSQITSNTFFHRSWKSRFKSLSPQATKSIPFGPRCPPRNQSNPSPLVLEPARNYETRASFRDPSVHNRPIPTAADPVDGRLTTRRRSIIDYARLCANTPPR